MGLFYVLGIPHGAFLFLTLQVLAILLTKSSSMDWSRASSTPKKKKINKTKKVKKYNKLKIWAHKCG